MTTAKLHEQLNAELERRRGEAKAKRAAASTLSKDKRQIERRIKALVDALTRFGWSKKLHETLQNLEVRLAAVNGEMGAEPVAQPKSISLAETRNFLFAQLSDLHKLLVENRGVAQLALQQHLGTLTLIADLENGLPVFRVRGGIRVIFAIVTQMPSQTVALLPWHSEETMQFELVVPARTLKADYRNHPKCDPAVVTSMIEGGKSFSEIATSLGTSISVVRRVVRALGKKPNRRKKKVDYLNHPKCPVDQVKLLREQGQTPLDIAMALGVTRYTVSQVLRAIALATGEPVKRGYPSTRKCKKRRDYLNHRKCPADETARLRVAGFTKAEIARRFRVCLEVVTKVLQAVEKDRQERALPVGRSKAYKEDATDYLMHPRCPAPEVKRLLEQGLSLVKIAEQIGVGPTLVLHVSQALRNPSKRFRTPRPPNVAPELSCDGRGASCPDDLSRPCS
jgi:uncharacterized protein YerC